MGWRWVVRLEAKRRDADGMSRPRAGLGVLPDDLYLPPEPVAAHRPAAHARSTWAVTNDWPERVPVTQAEVDVFEAWFGDLFDELFGSSR